MAILDLYILFSSGFRVMINYFLRNKNFGLQNELVVLGHFILIGVIRNKTASLLPSPGAASPLEEFMSVTYWLTQMTPQ